MLHLQGTLVYVMSEVEDGNPFGEVVILNQVKVACSLTWRDYFWSMKK